MTPFELLYGRPYLLIKLPDSPSPASGDLLALFHPPEVLLSQKSMASVLHNLSEITQAIRPRFGSREVRSPKAQPLNPSSPSGIKQPDCGDMSVVSHHMPQRAPLPACLLPNPLETYTSKISGPTKITITEHPCLLPVSDLLPRPMLVWPHSLWLLPITTLAILFAIGLAVTAPGTGRSHFDFHWPLLTLCICSSPGDCYSFGGSLTWPYVSHLACLEDFILT